MNPVRRPVVVLSQLALCLALLVLACAPLPADTTEQKLEKLRRLSEKLEKIDKVLKAIDGFGKGEAETPPKPSGPPKIYEPAPDAQFSFEPYGLTGRSLYPSFILSTATIESKPGPEDLTRYGDEMGAGYVGVLLHNIRKDDKVVVEVACDGLIQPSRCSFTARNSEVVVLASPKLKLDFVALARASQTRPVNLSFKVSRNGVEADEVTQTWQLRQMNDCLYALNLPQVRRDGVRAKKFQDVRFMFAAYVNENHPFVDQILKEAKATGVTDQFVGYQLDEAEVGRQIKAVWLALQRRGITYSSILNTTAVADMGVQHVRFLDESIGSTQANCVDGSVLMVSVLKKIGLRCHLVLVPSHCYVAVYTQEPHGGSGGHLIGIETTLLGKGSTLEEAISAASFDAPTSIKRNADKFSIKDSGYLAVDVELARQIGIMPLPYNK